MAPLPPDAVRVIFMGTAELARPSLAALARAPEFQLLAIVTQPDRPAGRSLRLLASPVKQEAQERGLPLLQPERARHPEFIQTIARLQPHLIVVVAYGQLLPTALLEVPPYGCLNVHASLLPKFRGAAPIQWAILEGEEETGVTIMKMDAGLDTGPILSQRKTALRAEDNSQTLHDRLAEMGANLLLETIPPYLAGSITPSPQPATGASYARKITKEDGKIDWSAPARQILNKVRAFHPWPGAFTFVTVSGHRLLLKIWDAAAEPRPNSAVPGEIIARDKRTLIIACGQDALRLIFVQRESGRRVSIQEFLTGSNLRLGDRLGV